MATLELSPLSEHLEADQIKAVKKALAEAGVGALSSDEHAETSVLDRNIDDDVLTDFMDRLDANDAAADIYVPVDFEDVIEVDGMRIGSTHALGLVLDSLKEDFFVDEDDDDDEDEEVKDERLQHIWKVLAKGAKTASKRGLCLFVRG